MGALRVKGTMQKIQTMWSCAVLAVLTVVAGGCGGGEDGFVAESLEIAGAVMAPNGQLAIGGDDLAPVPGATVELIEVDGLGNQIGPVLATSLTSTTGHYTLVLPPGLSLSAKLVVRVTGTSGSMRGLVVSENVDITPASEYVARKLTSDGNSLDNISLNEVLTIQGHIEQFDFFVAPTIEETIANLDEDAGPSLAPLLDLAQQPAGDASTIAGDYCLVQLGLMLGTFQETFVYTDVGELTIADEGNGAGSITAISASESEAFQGAQSNGMGGAMYNLITQFDLVLEEPDLPLQVSADGSFTLLEPFEEEIFAPGEPGFPGGLRAPANATRLCPLANGIFAGISYYEETLYDMDGNALDLSSPRGKSFEYGLAFVVKQGPVSNATLDGETYGVVSLGQFFQAGGSRELFSDFGTVVFTSTGATTGTIDANVDVLGLNRMPLTNSLGANILWGMTGAGGVDDPTPELDPEMRNYALDPATGALTFGAGTDEPEMACVSPGGEFFVLGLDLDEGDPIDGACRGVLLGIRLGTANPSISNKTYKVLVLEKGVETSGSVRINRLLGASITMTGAATLSLTGTGATISRSNDFGDGLQSETEDAGGEATYAFTGTDGRVTITFDDATLEGFMNADGSVGALRLYSSDIAEGGEASLGMVILIEQD